MASVVSMKLIIEKPKDQIISNFIYLINQQMDHTNFDQVTKFNLHKDYSMILCMLNLDKGELHGNMRLAVDWSNSTEAVKLSKCFD